MLAKKMKFFIENTKAGYVGFSWTDKGIAAVTLPCRDYAEALAELEPAGVRCGHGGAIKPRPGESAYGLSELLKNYFAGSVVDFKSCSVDLTAYTPFQVRVLAAVREIPYGSVMSYGQVARAIGKPRAFRAVGGALSKNRLLYLIPCHRVIRSDGTPGGFAGGKWKEKLLRLEDAWHYIDDR